VSQTQRATPLRGSEAEAEGRGAKERHGRKADGLEREAEEEEGEVLRQNQQGKQKKKRPKAWGQKEGRHGWSE